MEDTNMEKMITKKTETIMTIASKYDLTMTQEEATAEAVRTIKNEIIDGVFTAIVIFLGLIYSNATMDMSSNQIFIKYSFFVFCSKHNVIGAMTETIFLFVCVFVNRICLNFIKEMRKKRQNDPFYIMLHKYANLRILVQRYKKLL